MDPELFYRDNLTKNRGKLHGYELGVIKQILSGGDYIKVEDPNPSPSGTDFVTIINWKHRRSNNTAISITTTPDGQMPFTEIAYFGANKKYLFTEVHQYLKNP